MAAEHDETPRRGGDPECHYLIVSDLHLRGGFTNTTAGLYHFDEEFADFLRYYRLHRRSDRPWRLVIAGDFIEFLYITDRPDKGERLVAGCTWEEEEEFYGPESEALKARWKLDTILRSSHPQLLIAIARFIAEGNELVCLRGNHDAEMFWPEVQEHFRRLIARHHPDDVALRDMREAVAARVHFPDWFWHEPGVIYVEHGCQYDPFCSFEYFLNPVDPRCPTRIDSGISELAIRFFTNPMKGIDAMAAENIMSVSQYIGWVLTSGFRRLPDILRLYGLLVKRIVGKSGPHDPAAERAVRDEHLRRVDAMDVRFGLKPGTARQIDAMHQTPIMRSRIGAIRFSGADIVSFITAAVLGAFGLLVVAPDRWGLLGALFAFTAAGVVAYMAALRFGSIAEAAQLRRTAENVAALTGSPLVVFGHSHSAGNWQLDEHTEYMNVGTWVPSGDNAFFIFAEVVTGGDRPVASVLRWNKRERCAAEYVG